MINLDRANSCTEARKTFSIYIYIYIDGHDQEYLKHHEYVHTCMHGREDGN